MYPEQSAAGLWTTPSDLAHFALGVAEDLAGRGDRVVSAATVRTMLTPVLDNWGLGLEVGGATNRKFFTHGGVDACYQCVLVAYDDGQDGAVIMTNGDRGGFLANEILRTVAYTYHWPDFAPLERAVAPIAAARLDKFIGYYRRGMAYSTSIVMAVVTILKSLVRCPCKSSPKVPLNSLPRSLRPSLLSTSVPEAM